MSTTYYTVHAHRDDGIWLGEYGLLDDAIAAAHRYTLLYDTAASVSENRWSGSHWLPGRVVFECGGVSQAAA